MNKPKSNKSKRRVQTMPKAQSTSSRTSAVNANFKRSSLPNSYPRSRGDEVSLRFSTSYIAEIPSGGGTVKQLIVLGTGAGGINYVWLSELCPVYNAMLSVYSRWMISDLEVEVRATGVGGAANTYLAASYIPSNTSVDNVPNTLGEVSSSNHFTQSSLGTVGHIRTNCASFFNDWRQIADADNSDQQCGLIQVYGSGAGGSTITTAGIIHISGTLHFCGLRG